MSFTDKDKNEVMSLLSKITTTLDAVGRSMRDIRLVMREHPDWDHGVMSILEEYRGQFATFLSLGDSQEQRIIDRVLAAVEE